MNNLSIDSYPLPKLVEIMTKKGLPSFRGGQIFSWLHQKQVTTFDEMNNLPLSLRSELAKEFEITSLSLAQKQVSAVDSTIKYLFALDDGEQIETVQMEYEHGNSLCISTQVGCRMGCSFCASAIGGLVRNLSPGEMLQQVYMAEKLSANKISSIVLMGIGEPLDNLDNVLLFFEIINHKEGKHLSLRNITLSTCGIVDQLDKLSKEKLPITLAISLHAVNDSDRNAIMPINKKWNIQSLLQAGDDYFKITGRRVSYEYALIDGVNDSAADATELAALLKNRNVHINLIPVNPVPGKSFRQSQKEQIRAFQRLLQQQGMTTTIRRELGRDITAACGQLRRQKAE